LLLPADAVLEPEVPPEVPELPDVPLVLLFTEVASPGRLTGATFARAWKAVRVLLVAALERGLALIDWCFRGTELTSR
jgi:hypothetical protein